MKRPYLSESCRWVMINAPDTLLAAVLRLDMAKTRFYREVGKKLDKLIKGKLCNWILKKIDLKLKLKS